MRLLFFFVMTFYSYVFKSGGVVLAGREFGKGGAKGKPGWDDLKNSLVFTWSFVEMLLWFWVSDFYAPLWIYCISTTRDCKSWPQFKSRKSSLIYSAYIRFTSL